jgi:hypothetical protein
LSEGENRETSEANRQQLLRKSVAANGSAILEQQRIFPQQTRSGASYPDPEENWGASGGSDGAIKLAVMWTV